MRVGAVVVNYRRPDLCLSLLGQVALDGRVDFAVVINNGVSCRLNKPDLHILSVPTFLVSLPHNVGFAQAANRGIRECLIRAADAVLLLNPDVVMLPGAVIAMTKRLEAEDGNVIVVPQENTRATVSHGRQQMVRKGTPLGRWMEEHRIPTRAAYAWLIPRRTLESVGLFDPAFFFGREDTDYCIRLWLHGGRIVSASEANITHLLEQGSPKDKHTTMIRCFHMMRGRVLLARKYNRHSLGVRFHIGQTAGIARDMAAGVVKQRSARCLVWQLRGLIPGSRWPDEGQDIPAA